MDWIYGHTGISLFDYWTFAHAAFWFFIGTCLSVVFAKRARVIAYFVCLGLAFWWEVFERFAEKQWPLIWQSPESWWNAWCSDLLTTLMVLLAYYGYDRWRPK